MGNFLCKASALILFGASYAQASLRVYPVSLSFGSHSKSAELTVKQSYANPTWVDVQPVFFEMDESGQLREVSYEKGVGADGSAMRMVRFSPKRFLLKPGESQIIRVRASLPADFESRAYRVHLKFIPEETAEAAAGATGEANKIQYQLRARVAMAIPVYVGAVAKEASLENLQVAHDQEGYKFQVDLTQKIPGIVRGDLELFVENKENPSKRILVGKVTGMASYRALRKVEFDFFDNFKNFAADKTKRLIAEFKEPSTEDAKVIATAQANL